MDILFYLKKSTLQNRLKNLIELTEKLNPVFTTIE